MLVQERDDDRATATMASRVRGLALGLALGDAVGGHPRGKVPATGMLAAGAATQLAAWTIEASLRNLTRYGRLHPHLTDIGLYAYQRWAHLRGMVPRAPHNWNPFFELPGDLEGKTRGWLVDVPAMAVVRGTSPSTVRALMTGSPSRSAGCQGMLRVLPVGALALIRYSYPDGRIDPDTSQAEALAWARNLALLTHNDGQEQNASVVATRVLIEALNATDHLRWAIKRAAYDPVFPEHPVDGDLEGALARGFNSPGESATLARLAPDTTSWSALAGGLYSALSFPGSKTIPDALAFASTAPGGHSVATFTGAILGARYGYEVLPQDLLCRLELGWVMDRLANDLAADLAMRQGGTAWRDEFGDYPAIDPWWDIKYPGV